MKNKGELSTIKEEAEKKKAEAPYTKSVPITDEELEQVSGGIAIFERSEPEPMLIQKA